MIRLKTLLENNYYPSLVYHFTTAPGLVGIINSNKLKSAMNKYVSFTEDAELWAFQEFESGDEIGVRLEFSSDDLPPLSPYIYQGAPGETYEQEQEWVSKSGDIMNIEDIITDITALQFTKEYLRNNLPGHIFSQINFI
jgi:hypothetical protein